MPEVRVGFAAIDITPPPGLPLMGNFRDDYLARGVHDPLMAKAIVFEDPQGTKAAVLAIDVCMLDRHNVALIRDAIGRTANVPPENVLVHATHTHSAPAPHDRFLFGLDYRPYRAAAEAMLVKAASSVAIAEQNLAEAQLSIGFAREERLSFNRRLRRRDGTTQMNWEALSPGFDPDQVDAAWGPIDPQLTCLVVERAGAARGGHRQFWPASRDPGGRQLAVFGRLSRPAGGGLDADPGRRLSDPVPERLLRQRESRRLSQLCSKAEATA